ncbi:hypothetical protein BSKO_02432 [Bryopsis sp. KO-2023]|nr:hypothetical protein BSKO_02432 [Bryopsis sp. KO-2023]
MFVTSGKRLRAPPLYIQSISSVRIVHIPLKTIPETLHTLTERIQLRLSWRYTQNYFCDLRYFLKVFLGGLQTVLTFFFASSLLSKRPWSSSTPTAFSTLEASTPAFSMSRRISALSMSRSIPVTLVARSGNLTEHC